jgi:uncharacterized coiled-coil DUF342 family protein
MDNLEACIVEIKKAIARIEEQMKTIFNNLNEYKVWSEKLHAEHFQAANNLRRETSELCRNFDVRLSRHDVDILGIQNSLTKMETLLQQIAHNAAKTRGIALGLGMAGGAIVSILTILAEIIK